VKVPRYNYIEQFGGQAESLGRRIGEMLLSGDYVLSREVAAFEQAFGEYLGAPHTLGVNSGTDALLLALMALEIGPGDEVITQANTFHATVAAIRLAGARPVLVDAIEDSFQIDASEIESQVTSRTRAILPVHLYGYPAPLDGILNWAGARGLDVIEDAAQAHGARVHGKRVGTLGRIGCFSFHPSKNLAAAGDAGAVVTRDAEVAERLAQLRALGQAGQNDHRRVGLNSKLDAIQAVVLTAKLPRLDAWNERRREVAAWYRERLRSFPLYFQTGEYLDECVFHLFQVGTDRRDALLTYLREHGVDAVVRYPVPIHLQPAFADQGWKAGQFPVAERLAKELLCLPIRPDMAVNEVDYVADCVGAFFSSGVRP
jgi:dTDP-4-amino-4,6-dideoxygalactose transaminase